MLDESHYRIALVVFSDMHLGVKSRAKLSMVFTKPMNHRTFRSPLLGIGKVLKILGMHEFIKMVFFLSLIRVWVLLDI